jgi:hypothetical protein
MIYKEEERKEAWRDGVYLCTATDNVEADILESKLRGEGIPCERRWKGAGNFLEIFMGVNNICPIELYVPAESLADAQNIIIPFPLAEGEGEGEGEGETAFPPAEGEGEAPFPPAEGEGEDI